MSVEQSGDVCIPQDCLGTKNVTKARSVCRVSTRNSAKHENLSSRGLTRTSEVGLQQLRDPSVFLGCPRLSGDFEVHVLSCCTYGCDWFLLVCGQHIGTSPTTDSHLT